MSSFLNNVAHQLLNTYGTDLSRVTVVFPNKRTALFMGEELNRQSGFHIKTPTYTTISDLFRSLSDLEVADPIKQVCDLHKSFVKCTGINDSLDHFYGWGQLLIADFDDVDKHLVSADRVFANLRDVHEYDDLTYLTQQQKDIIRKFFSNFSEDHNTELKQRFLSLWSHLSGIYHDFNERLTAQGLTYEGSLYRSVIENGTFLSKSHSSLSNDYVFVGFNLLQPVEQALIRHLESEGKAQLIQDTDKEPPKEITFVSASTNNIQAHYVSTWLKEHNRINAGSKTAIVLADESLLQTVIHSLPPEVSKVNITTGYPLSQTAIASTVLQQLTLDIPELADTVKSSAQGQTDPLEIEAHFHMYTLLTRLQELIDCGDLQVTNQTLQRLLIQLVNTTTIPFHGEPLEGLQIMGVLETRNLDFYHVLVLSCNEGNLPKGINDTSFIPHSLRKAYGLTTIDNKVSIYANYFHRLLQRAQDVTLVYNNATTDGKTGEMSRFMLQMMVEGHYPITYKTLQAGQTPVLHHPRPITKTEAVIQRMQSLSTLSPSALALYLRCPLQFFYHYIAELEEYEDEDKRVDNRLFGNIFHKAAQILYQKMMSPHSSLITAEAIEECLKTKVDIERAVDEAIKFELFHIEDPMTKMPTLTGLQIINREVIIRYVRQLLEIDHRLTPFTILGLEKKVCAHLSKVHVGGIIDRIDKITLPDGSERIRVVDYKTGSGRLKPLPNVASIFDPSYLKNHSDYYLQTFLYSIIEGLTGGPVSPCLLFIQHAGIDNYDPTLLLGQTPITDINEVKEEFMEHLNTLVEELFNPSVPFIPTEEKARCKSCPFSSLCGI